MACVACPSNSRKQTDTEALSRLALATRQVIAELTTPPG